MRASDLGACTKAHVARTLGYKEQPPPAVLEAAYLRGHEHEAACKAALEADGYNFVEEGDPLYNWDEHQISVSFMGITGHLDGIVGEPEELFTGRVWEAKHPKAWTPYERAIRTDKDTPLTLRYKWQSSIYMHALGLEQMVSCWDGERVKSFVIEVPPFTREEIRTRVEHIQSLTELPSECEEGCFDDWSCPFRYLHQRQEVVENEVVDVWVGIYDDAGEKIKAAKKIQAESKAELEKLMVFDDKIETASSIVTSYEQANPAKYDMERIAAALGVDMVSLKEYLLPQTKSKRLKVTRKGGSDE